MFLKIGYEADGSADIGDTCFHLTPFATRRRTDILRLVDVLATKGSFLGQ